jgi:hypothetical protein
VVPRLLFVVFDVAEACLGHFFWGELVLWCFGFWVLVFEA